MFKKRLFFCLLLVPFSIIAQQKFSKEFSFTTDNDLYVSFNRDRYYTSGIFLNYRYITNNENVKLEKKIFEWQLGHEMFTPNKSIVQTIEEHDRPFASYLYGGFSVKNVYKNNKILSYTLQAGVIGPNAFGKELQDFIHGIYGFKKGIGWQFQIKNAIALNFDVDYIHFLGKNDANTMDVSWVNSAKLGTVYTNLSSGFYVRFGLTSLEKIVNSIAFNTNLNDVTTTSTRAIESFFFLKPTLRYAFYDATLEGSFLNNTSLVTKEIIPVVFNLEIGLKFTASRFNFGYIFNYNTSKSEGLRYTYGNKYGTISINYLIR
tara:strand:+ start:287 stop:1240 length:954 start_codon:yes stop_codon:yes gene_type:complete